MKLEGKKALVTGASRGIGRAIALALAAEGADVVVNYAGSEAAAKEVAAEIEAMGRKAFVVQADISSNEAATAMVDEVVKEFGRIDILVNNAGITRDGLLMRMSEEDFSDVIDVNLKGTFHCIRFASRQMMKQRSGKIINLASVVGISGNAGQVNYAASKAGIIGMTKSTAKELASRGIGTWMHPLGGYFISFEAPEGCAKEIVSKCKEAGVVLTGAGSPFPYKKDPKDSVIRIAPTYPSLAELEQAANVFVVVVRMAAAEKFLAEK